MKTFTTVVWSDFYWMILALYTLLGYKVRYMNIITAFFYRFFAEEIYIKLPHGYKEEDYVCCLNKTLYGLKQASCVWYEMLQLFLKGIGFQTVQLNPAVFISKNVIIAAYVDDLLLCGSDSHALNWLEKHLQQHFRMTNFRQVSHYLNMKVDVSEGSELITIKQSIYIQSILKCFNMQNCTSLFTSMDPFMFESFITNTEKVTSEEILWYQQAVGSLMWPMCQIRPDITFTVGVVAYYASNSN